MLEDFEEFDREIDLYLEKNEMISYDEDFERFLSWWRSLNEKEPVSYGEAFAAYCNLDYYQI